jgi:hypothetical protein
MNFVRRLGGRALLFPEVNRFLASGKDPRIGRRLL